MKKSTESIQDSYITVPIHESFYVNEQLQVPTVIKEYKNIEASLIKSQFIACITIQVEQLTKIEYLYGSRVYYDLLQKISDTIKTLKDKEFRKEDTFVIDLFEIDTFILFLSAPRNKGTKLLVHLEAIAERARVSIKTEIYNTLNPFHKEYASPSIGYSLVIKNPMINNMRLIMQLITGSKKMGEFLNEKQYYMSKYTLQKIIIEQQIHTLFQPIVNLETLEIIGYEALSRGPKDTEFNSPLILFVFAAECGLSFELDSLCRKKAFERVRNLDTDKKIFVNTLTMTIHDPEFRGAYLKQLLEDLKIKPENVVFELNEKLAIDNYDLFRSSMKDYFDIGIVHASDDIGAGYSDLERIMELSPGYLKIDINLVRDIDKSYIKQEIIKAMVNLAKGIGSYVISEGVETKGEYQKLKELGVTYGQGYLFGRPADKLPARKKVRID